MSSKKNNSSSNNDSPDKETSVTGIKKFSFYIILVFLILLPLVLLEIGLVLFNYGGNIELFVKKQTAAGLVYVLNPNVTSRYFFQKGVKTPIPITQTFTAKKDSLTFRIFCLGASTTQGFPYEVNAAFPAVLQNILSTLFPDRKVNVINCGITGLSSHSVLDLGREILKKYEPDLLIVYSGQNEFYGVFGQASRLSLFKSRRLTKLFLTLQKFRTTQLLRNVASRVRAPRVPQTSLENAETLMGLMAKDIEIRLDSPIFHQAANNFRKNITDLVKLADRENTPIMICSLVDNQRDFAPFASLHSENFSKQDSIAWQSFIRQADELFSAGEFEAAIEGYQKALALDSSYAATHYQIAHCYGKIGNDGAAQKHYRSAKDHDVVRFRAPFLFNKYLQNITRDYNVPFVDVYKEFAQTSRAGVIGNNLILEHVHPNQQGYFLIAKSIAQCMYQHKFVKPVWNWNNNKSDSVYIAMSHLTDLDREVVNYKLFTLTSHWPFPTADSTRSYQRIGNEETERMAKALVDRG
ncbi:tetratricopeptide repeat protein, partial [candidate division KSB1 bacterium]|nr:tetratricopeptide repeat protein [candidate division KSB1 bacterium]